MKFDKIYALVGVNFFFLKSCRCKVLDIWKVWGGVDHFFLAKKIAISPFLTPAETEISVLLSASVERLGVSRMRDFFFRGGWGVGRGVFFFSKKKNCNHPPFWHQRKQKYRCHYPHRSRDLVSPVGGIFFCILYI